MFYTPPHKNPRFVSEFKPHVRKKWLSRVFLILTGQLLFAVVGMLWASSDWAKHNKDLDAAHPYVFIVTAILSGIILLIMYFVKFLAFWYPVNLVLLILFTLCVTYLLATVASEFNTLIVLHTLVIDTFIILTLMLYTWLPWGGYSHMAAGFYMVFVVGVIALIIMLPNPQNYAFDWNWDWSWVVRKDNDDRDRAFDAVGVWITLLAALVFAILINYSIYDISTRLEPNKHVVAAFTLYVNFVLLIAFSLKGIGSTLDKLRAGAWFRR